MATTKQPLLPSDVMADAQAVVEQVMKGKALDPEVARRVHERAEAITVELRQKHGELDIGVPAIRELRGEPPES